MKNVTWRNFSISLFRAIEPHYAKYCKKIDLYVHLNVKRVWATKLEMDFSMAYDVFEVTRQKQNGGKRGEEP